MYTVGNIDIFVLTHNRAEYLQMLLQSFANQTVDINKTKIKVLCNDCTDNTKEIVESFPFAEYIPTYGKDGNYYKAMELVNKEYFILCHDDDMIHPEYFEKVLKILNYLEEKPVLIGGGYTNFYDEKAVDKQVLTDLGYKYIYEKNNVEKTCKISLPNKFLIAENEYAFSKLIISGYCSISYAAAIFKTEVYKKFDNLKLMDKYGKLADFFVMAEILKYGPAAIIYSNNTYFHRLHMKNDTFIQETQLSETQFDNVINSFEKLTNCYEGFSFNRIWTVLKSNYKCVGNKKSFNEYFSRYSQQIIDNNLYFYFDVYNKRHNTFIDYIKYFLLLKFKKRIIMQLKARINAGPIKKDVVTIQFD